MIKQKNNICTVDIKLSILIEFTTQVNSNPQRNDQSILKMEIILLMVMVKKIIKTGGKIES